MDIIRLLILIAVVGVAAWLLTMLTPEPFDTIIYVVAGLACVVLVARALTGGGGGPVV